MPARAPCKEARHAVRDHRPRCARRAREASGDPASAPRASRPARACRPREARRAVPRPDRQPHRARGRFARRCVDDRRPRPLRDRGHIQPRRGEAVPAGAAVGVPLDRPRVTTMSVALTAEERALVSARRARVLERLDGGVMLLAAAPERPRTADILYPYRQDSDFAYVTGFLEPEAVCVLAPDAPQRFVLFVRPRDPERAIWVGQRAGV